jgi:hypothetical protein
LPVLWEKAIAPKLSADAAPPVKTSMAATTAILRLKPVNARDIIISSPRFLSAHEKVDLSRVAAA